MALLLVFLRVWLKLVLCCFKDRCNDDEFNASVPFHSADKLGSVQCFA